MESMEERDAETVSRARQGDGEAFRALVEQHSRTVFRLAYRMTGNEHDADDVVQDTFLRAYRQLGRFEERAHFGTWLYRIAVNCSLDLMRRRRRHDERSSPLDTELSGGRQLVDDNLPAPDRAAFNSELRDVVTTALETLSPMERSAFVLRHYEGLSIDEIGKVLGLRVNATKHSIFRAVRKMRRELEPVMRDSALAR
jgi:RNA polymerase sigma-70 factor (ECF subfamily)